LGRRCRARSIFHPKVAPHPEFPAVLGLHLRKAPLKVRNQFEFGLTLGSATPWELLWVADPEIGPSYIFGDELQVFLINFGFPF
jgi:hypothetical protein